MKTLHNEKIITHIIRIFVNISVIVHTLGITPEEGTKVYTQLQAINTCCESLTLVENDEISERAILITQNIDL